MGNGAAALYNLMEDAATAEISRAQLWQWLKHEAVLVDGAKVDRKLLRKLIPEEIVKIKEYVGEAFYEKARFPEAIELFEELIFNEEFEEFLTIKAYSSI